MTTTRGERGRWGEAQAAAFLQRQGFVVIEHNFYTTVGEIDIVARKGDDYYFVEVKTREAGPMATDLAVTSDKLRKLEKTARRYCYQRQIVEVGLIFARVLVVVHTVSKRVQFRFAVII